MRDGAKGADPQVNLKLFRGFLETLPVDASPTIRFRAKANIGLQLLAHGDGPEAVRWLMEACDEAPDDPRAAANRALALWLRGDPQEAYRFGRERLAADPTNEGLAQYLPQIAVTVPSVANGLDGIPDSLRETEAVTVGQSLFLRGRDMRPDWWEWVRAGAARFPGSEHLRLLAAASQVDEITRDEEAQRSQIFRPEQRERLAEAAAVLDADWQARPWLLKNGFDDAPHTLAGAMIAHKLLHDRDLALARAERIASEGLSYPDILANAVMVAMSFGRVELARRLIALSPDDPVLAFHAGTIAVQEGDWHGAVELFGRAEVPESERRLVETVIELAPLREENRLLDGTPVDPRPLETLIEATRDSPRGLILIAQVASDLGLDEISEKAFAGAVEAVPADCHLATRLMVAGYAERAGSAAAVIGLLDGHLPFEGFEREHERLAIAHANEHPHRPRNLAYFDRLPAALRRPHAISRAEASVLVDVERYPEAIAILRRLHAETPSDSFVTLRLVEALQRSKDATGAGAVIRGLDLTASKGAPEHLMALAQLTMREGFPERAYPAAYDLVRRHADNASVVLGYAGMGLLLQAPNPMFAASTAGASMWVSIQGPDGTAQDFVIDEGGDFFGIRVLSPTSGMASRVSGLRRGGTFEVPKLGMDPETWTVTDIVSKYLRLHHRVLEEFETRFPDQPGFARFTVSQGNVDGVLDVVRRSAEQNAANARTYMEMAVPLAFVARGLGGNVVSFAAYVRRLGGQIVTCLGSGEERERGIALAGRYRGRGAVLDPYTAWVAFQIGILPALKAWFGELRTPASTMAMIDRMIEREDEGRGQEQMTVGFHNGQFYRDIVTDELRDDQIAALTRVRDAITEGCDVVSVLVPNEISEAAETVLGIGGSRSLDASFLASATNSILLSDDLRYRDLAAAAVGCDGVWLQATLLAAMQARQLPPSDYARAVVGLAQHAHDHIALTGPLLYLIAREDRDGLPDLKAALRYLAGPKADISSHRAVFHDFLELLWPPDDVLPLLKTKAATGVGLEAYLAHRRQDWVPLLDDVIRRSRYRRGLIPYLASWLRGHFISLEILEGGTASTKQGRGSRKAQSARAYPARSRA